MLTLLGFFSASLLVIGSAYQMIATRRIARFLSAPPTESVPGPPPVTILRPMKPGVPDAAGKLAALAAAVRPSDQIIAGFEPGTLPETAIEGVEVLAFPGRGFPNRKIDKLDAMAALARHDHWIVMDSEALVTREFLDRFRTEWLQSDVITAGYRFAGATNLPEAMDHAPVLLSLWPGLMFADLRFTLGACTGVTRADVEGLGGWAALAGFLAEDFQLGHQLAAKGRSVQLSRAVLVLESDAMTWRDWFRHQMRVAVTYRVCAPAGWAGAVVTLTALWAMLVLAVAPVSLWIFAAAGIAIRAGCAMRNAGHLQAQTSLRAIVLAMLFEPVFWIWSWATARVWWGGRWLRVTPEGRIQCLPPPEHDQSRANGEPR